MAKPRIADAEGTAAVAAALDGEVPRATLALAVRWLLQALEQRAPGNSLEVRVPPYGAVQVVEGPRHTRGTPPNVIETDPRTWLELATGRLAWPDALAAARATASGTRADLAPLLPILRDPRGL